MGCSAVASGVEARSGYDSVDDVRAAMRSRAQSEKLIPQLLPSGCCGALFGVGSESDETRVSVKRREIGILFDFEVRFRVKTVVNGIP